MYSLHDIEVNGLDLAEVLECEIESRAGEHSTLVILARVTEEEFVFEISDCQDLEVLLREGEGRKILFSGIQTDPFERSQLVVGNFVGRTVYMDIDLYDIT